VSAPAADVGIEGLYALLRPPPTVLLPRSYSVSTGLLAEQLAHILCALVSRRAFGSRGSFIAALSFGSPNAASADSRR